MKRVVIGTLVAGALVVMVGNDAKSKGVEIETAKPGVLRSTLTSASAAGSHLFGATVSKASEIGSKISLKKPAVVAVEPKAMGMTGAQPYWRNDVRLMKPLSQKPTGADLDALSKLLSNPDLKQVRFGSDVWDEKLKKAKFQTGTPGLHMVKNTFKIPEDLAQLKQIIEKGIFTQMSMEFNSNAAAQAASRSLTQGVQTAPLGGQLNKKTGWQRIVPSKKTVKVGGIAGAAALAGWGIFSYMTSGDPSNEPLDAEIERMKAQAAELDAKEAQTQAAQGQGAGPGAAPSTEPQRSSQAQPSGGQR